MADDKEKEIPKPTPPSPKIVNEHKRSIDAEANGRNLIEELSKIKNQAIEKEKTTDTPQPDFEKE